MPGKQNEMPLSEVPREKKPAAFILVNSDGCGVFETQWGGIVSGGKRPEPSELFSAAL
jgi:hypothetical protein